MRLFVAIELPERVKDRLTALSGGLHGAKWAEPEQMHVTLRFIGEVDAGQADDIAASLGQVRDSEFTASLAGLGEFSNRGRPTTLWVGVEANPALLALQSKIETAVRRAGLSPEGRKFHPHVTLARFGPHRANGRPNLGKYFAEHEPFRAGPFAVDEFVLFSSRLGSERAAHHAEARYPLGFARAEDAAVEEWR